MTEKGCYNMKNVKAILFKLLKFILCNLAAFGIGFVVLLAVIFFTGIEQASEERFLSDLVSYLSMTASVIIPMYFYYFLGDSEYKRFYLKNTEDGHDDKSVMKMHIKTFAKIDFSVVFVVSLLLAFVPAVIQGKTGMSFIFGSAAFFVGFMPTYIFSSTSIIFQFIGAVLWDAYIVLVYLICLKLAYRKWDNDRIRRPDKQ